MNDKIKCNFDKNEYCNHGSLSEKIKIGIKEWKGPFTQLTPINFEKIHTRSLLSIKSTPHTICLYFSLKLLRSNAVNPS